MEFRESYKRVGRKKEGKREDRDSTGRPTKSTKLDPWWLSGPESLTRERAWDGPRASAYICSDEHLCFHAGSLATGARDVPEPVACLPACGSHTPKWTALSSLNGRRCTQSAVT